MGGLPQLFPARSRDRFSGLLVCGSAPLGFALVPELLTLRQRKLHFNSAILEIHAGWNEGKALLLGLADELVDLFLMNQQLPRAQRGVIIDVSVLVGANVAVEQPKFSVLY